MVTPEDLKANAGQFSRRLNYWTVWALQLIRTLSKYNPVSFRRQRGYCTCKCGKIRWWKNGWLCLCLLQSTSKWRIITCLCLEGQTTTTTPMWNSFWTLLNAYLFRYPRTLRLSLIFPQWCIVFIIYWVSVMFCFFASRQCGRAGVTPQRTPNSQSCFTRMALPSWVRCAPITPLTLNFKFTLSVCSTKMLYLLPGPPSQAMWALGDKIASSIVAQTAGIPTLPWSGTGSSHLLSGPKMVLLCGGQWLSGTGFLHNPPPPKKKTIKCSCLTDWSHKYSAWAIFLQRSPVLPMCCSVSR